MPEFEPHQLAVRNKLTNINQQQHVTDCARLIKKAKQLICQRNKRKLSSHTVKLISEIVMVIIIPIVDKAILLVVVYFVFTNAQIISNCNDLEQSSSSSKYSRSRCVRWNKAAIVSCYKDDGRYL